MPDVTHLPCIGVPNSIDTQCNLGKVRNYMYYVIELFIYFT
jgi:hypothetical protein